MLWTLKMIITLCFCFNDLFVPVLCTCAHWGCMSLKSFCRKLFLLTVGLIIIQVIGIWSHGLFQILRWCFFLVPKTMTVSFWPVMACGMSWQTKRCATSLGGAYFSGTRKMACHCPQKGERELILLHKQLQSTSQTVPFRKEAKTTSLWLWWTWKLIENLRARRDCFFNCTWVLEDIESWIMIEYSFFCP